VTKLLSPKGRGRQQNRGAGAAHGGVLLFVHADTILPCRAFERIGEVMADTSCAGGAFDLAIDSPRPAFRVIERVASLRSRATKIPYGDQAIFLRASRFRMLGGFREIPLMEDVELMQRVKRRGWKIAIIPEPVLTSARRWEKEGLLYGTLRNWCLVTLFYCGVSPERLARFYR